MKDKLAQGVSIFAAVSISAVEHVFCSDATHASNEIGAPASPAAATLFLVLPQAASTGTRAAISAAAWGVFMAFTSRSDKGSERGTAVAGAHQYPIEPESVHFGPPTGPGWSCPASQAPEPPLPCPQLEASDFVGIGPRCGHADQPRPFARPLARRPRCLERDRLLRASARSPRGGPLPGQPAWHGLACRSGDRRGGLLRDRGGPRLEFRRTSVARRLARRPSTERRERRRGLRDDVRGRCDGRL